MSIGPLPLARLRLASLLLAWGVLAQPLPGASAGQGVAAPIAERRAEILKMVRQDCGSCHGMTMKGGLGPALTPAALRTRPPDSLTATILQGRPGTAMPPWQDFLSADEAAWIVQQLQQGLPDVR
jgi:cytochrome c55X